MCDGESAPLKEGSCRGWCSGTGTAASSQSSGLGRGLDNSCGVRMPTHSKLLLFLHKEIRESVLVLIDFKKRIIRIVMGS